MSSSVVETAALRSRLLSAGRLPPGSYVRLLPLTLLASSLLLALWSESPGSCAGLRSAVLWLLMSKIVALSLVSLRMLLQSAPS